MTIRKKAFVSMVDDSDDEDIDKKILYCPKCESFVFLFEL